MIYIDPHPVGEVTPVPNLSLLTCVGIFFATAVICQALGIESDGLILAVFLCLTLLWVFISWAAVYPREAALVIVAIAYLIIAIVHIPWAIADWIKTGGFRWKLNRGALLPDDPVAKIKIEILSTPKFHKYDWHDGDVLLRQWAIYQRNGQFPKKRHSDASLQDKWRLPDEWLKAPKCPWYD